MALAAFEPARRRSVWVWAVPLGLCVSTGIFLFIGWIQPTLRGNERISLPDAIRFEFKVATAETKPPEPPKKQQTDEPRKRKPPQRPQREMQSMVQERTPPRRQSSPSQLSQMRVGLDVGVSTTAGGMGALLSMAPGGASGVQLDSQVAQAASMMTRMEYVQARKRQQIREQSRNGRLNELVKRGSMRVTKPKLRLSPKPEYPEKARKEQKEGWVHVRLLVSVDGRVSDVEIVDSEPSGLFEEAIREVLPQWEFLPGTDGTGTPVEMWEEFKYEFKLQNAG